MKTAQKIPETEVNICRAEVQTPLGRLLVTATDEGVTSVHWALEMEVAFQTKNSKTAGPGAGEQSSARAEHWVTQAALELAQYFRGERKAFTVPTVLRGTPFQRAVWSALKNIPYGETRSYRDIAMEIGRDQAVRAVGQANRANPVSIIVPCHRVIGSGGNLVGYAGSQTHLKEGLLAIEGVIRKADA